MNNTDDLLFAFSEHLKVLNRSPATVNAYTDNAGLFLKVCPADDIRAVTTAMLKTWLADLYDHRTETGKPYSTGTICIKVRAVKRFFEFLTATNVIFIDPAETIKEPKKDRRIIAAPTAEQINTILEQPNLATLLGIRDRTIMEVFYSTGIRKAELCNLTIYDADLTGRMLRINQGKGQKDRVVPLGKHAVRFLREYIAKVRPHYTKKHPANRSLFVNKSGQRLRRQAVAVMVRQYAHKAGMSGRVGPHMFRHAFATVLVKNGADIVAVQKMLGHVDLRTTYVYVRSLGLDIKKVHQQTHPRERDIITRQAIKPAITRRTPHA